MKLTAADARRNLENQLTEAREPVTEQALIDLARYNIGFLMGAPRPDQRSIQAYLDFLAELGD